MEIVWWLLIGLVAGALARLLVPGRDRMSWGGTLLLGLIGSVVGGFLANVLLESDGEFSPAGLLGSIIGAILALLVWRAVAGRGARRGAF
ncbi:MAG TPA: GlsB/YeaQ/YmgE family stress response membrane protein [Actinomycetota bacterium]|nr:GlsB/YeaQ/YmgE family stress response membrane protein [Actinomycetota bacterium]